MKALVVDTNIWLDYYLYFRDYHALARRFIDASLASETNLLYSITQVPNITYLLNSLAKARLRESVGTLTENDAKALKMQAIASFQNLRQLATAVGADETDLWLAEKYYRVHSDFEDDLVMAAVTRAEAGYLVTNDEKLRANAPVPTISVAGAIALMEG